MSINSLEYKDTVHVLKQREKSQVRGGVSLGWEKEQVVNKSGRRVDSKTRMIGDTVQPP